MTASLTNNEPHGVRATQARRHLYLWFVLCVPVALILSHLSRCAALAALPNLRGNLAAHDPSTIIKCKDRYYFFYTGRWIQSKSSTDRIFWENGPPVFTVPPPWTMTVVPQFDGTFWAPDVIFLNGRYYLYYSVSTWGSQVSAIGLAINSTLDPADPNYEWIDYGPVIRSGLGAPFNAIDPSVLLDPSGNLWLAFGSYWNGIFGIDLNPATGLRFGPESPVYRLAYNESVEAACLYYRGGWYYLFVNWGSCCSGINSTYQIRVGRSARATGPFVDRNGNDMVGRGGTLFLEGTGKYVGPGHVGIISEGGQDWFSFHYYDANAWAANYEAYGPAKIALASLSWGADGWPVFTNDWSAIYGLDSDARDEHRQYHGLVQNGATFLPDAQRGSVLDLNGTNQYVWLPPGVGYARTFASVVNWRGGALGQRLLEFNAGPARYFRLTPASSENRLRCEIDAGNGPQVLQWTRPLPTNEWVHVAVAFDGTRGLLYLNGAPVATNNNIKISIVDVRPQTNSLGKSSLGAGAFFNGQVASFQVHGRALTATEIKAPVVYLRQPIDAAQFQPGSLVHYQGSATDFTGIQLASSNLSWRVEQLRQNHTNLVFGPVIGASGEFVAPLNATQGVLRVTLTAIDPEGRRATNSVSLVPGKPWTAFYPFSDGATDASNQFNGVLEGGATIQTDHFLGGVLNLSGNGQYVSLPSEAGALQTFSALVKWNGGAARQRIFDFGKNARASFYLTPKTSSGQMQCVITPDQFSYVQTIESSEAFPSNQWTQAAVSLDGRQGILYLNGEPVGVNNSVNLLPADLGIVNCWLGRSQSPADPFFAGQMDSVLLSSTALWPEQTLIAPPLLAEASGGQLHLSWPSWAGNYRLYSTGKLSAPATWVTAPEVPRLVDGFLMVATAIAGSNQFYRLQRPL